VRIRLSAYGPFSAEFRARLKDKKMVKYNAIKYSPEIYTVARIVRGNTEMPASGNAKLWKPMRQQYTLRNEGGQVLDQAGIHRLFFGSDLVAVPIVAPLANRVMQNTQRSRQLNRFTDYP